MPASTPSQALSVVWATAAAAKAAPSILPSRAMSTTPLRSQNSPAMAASTSGAASRIVLSSISRSWKDDARPASGRHRRRARPAREQRLELRPEHVLQRTGEQDDQALDDHDQVAC